MATQVGICNQALSLIGVAKEIANIETEKSAEAQACRRFYDDTLDEVLRDFPWPHAMVTTALGLVAEDPNDEWKFSYQYPTDCLMAHRILSALRPETRSSRIPYKIGYASTGRLIYTDREDAELQYTVRNVDPTTYPPDFSFCLALLLAAKIAPRLTAGDPFSIMNKVMAMYEAQKMRARGNAANEEQPDEEADAEMIRARE